MELTAERLRSLLSYDAETGVFVWIAPTSNRVKRGTVCKYKTSPGYIAVRIDRILIGAHRLAWLYMTGEWPIADVDHINGDRTNNRWSNLRAASRQQNLRNMQMRTRQNTSGFKGVSWISRCSLWHAAIGIDRKNKSLGYFRDPVSAARAYDAAAINRFGEFARTNASMGLLP